MEKKSAYPWSGASIRVVSGSFFTVVSEIIGAARNIILVPLFLWAWGKPAYGEWLTIYALVAYVSLADMGMQNYVVNRLTQAYSKGDLAHYNLILQGALALYTAIILIVSLLLCAFVYYAPLSHWLNIHLIPADSIKSIAIILGTYLLVGLLAGLVNGVYHSLGEYSRRAVISNFSEITLIMLLCAGLYAKGSFVLIAGLHYVPWLLVMCYCVWDIFRRHPEVTFFGSRLDWKIAAGFIYPSLFFLLIMCANALKINGTILVISGSLGAAAVAVFSIHRTLASLITKFLASINCALWPELTATEARQDYARLRLFFVLLLKFSLYLSFSFAIFLFFTGREIIAIWTHGRIEFHYVLWLCLLAYLPINVFWEAAGLFQCSANKHQRYALARLASAIAGIVLARFLVVRGGLAGAFVGFAAAELLICATLIPRETFRIIGLGGRQAIGSILLPGIGIFLPLCAVAWLVSYMPSPMFLRWGMYALVTFFTGALIGYYFWLTPEEKAHVVRAVRGLRGI